MSSVQSKVPCDVPPLSQIGVSGSGSNVQKNQSPATELWEAGIGKTKDLSVVARAQGYTILDVNTGWRAATKIAEML